MGFNLFGKKKGNDDVPKGDKAPKMKGKKADGLISFVNPAVSDIVYNRLEDECQLFRISHNGEIGYAVFGLNVDSIGGISIKDKRNEDKGGIIKELADGTIAHGSDEAALEKNLLIIIPTDSTVARMGEYSLLRNATYDVYCWLPSGEYVPLDSEISYSEIEALVSNHQNFSDVYQLSDDTVVDTVDETGDTDTFTGPVQGEVSSVPVDNTQVSSPESFDDEAMFDSTASTDYIQDASLPESLPEASDDEISFDNAGETVPAEDVYATLDSYIRSDSVKAADFNVDGYKRLLSQYQASGLALFDETPVDGGITSQELLEIKKQGNTELKAFRERCSQAIYTIWQQEMTKAVDRALRETDTSKDADTSFSKIAAQLEDGLETTRTKKLNAFAEYFQEVERQYQADLDAAKEAGAREAERSYRARYEQLHRDREEQGKFEAEASAQKEYQMHLAELEAKKSEYVKRLLDLAESGLNVALAKRIGEFFNGEQKIYAAYMQRIQDWLEKNRANDSAAVELERRRVENDARIEAIQREQAAKVEMLKSEYDAKAEQLRAEIDKLNAAHKAYIEEKQTELQRLKERLNEEAEAHKVAVDKLIVSKDEEYATKIQSLTREIEMQSKLIDELKATEQKRQHTMIGIMVTIALAAAAIGVVVGVLNGINLMSAACSVAGGVIVF